MNFERYEGDALFFITPFLMVKNMEDIIKGKWDTIMTLLETQYGISDIIIKTWIKTLRVHAQFYSNRLIFRLNNEYNLRV